MLGHWDGVIRRNAGRLIGNLANHGEWSVRWYCGTADTDCKVEFREAIAATIPSLTKLLEHWNEVIRRNAVRLIGSLVNHGEWSVRWYYSTANANCEVEFREAISSWIPSLIKAIEDEGKDKKVQLETIHLIEKLAKHGG
jgi:hypothetical protein